ncbi:DUF4214 domain-containing protein [Halomonas tibetensis]|uniref:DUF4214 domain-containing protein n=1 Tax=Halomonas tibetensis TaxID=2259590 RepID=A0ABV7B512_9GAMM
MTTAEHIQKVYIGLLGRAADKAGLDYWTQQIDSGALTIDQVRGNIVNAQPEYENGLGSMTRAQMVNQLYQNLFDRTAEPAGLDYWVNGGGSTVPADKLVLALINGAQAADTLALDNKTSIAQYYTEQAGDAYTLDSAEAAVADVDGSTTLSEARAAVDEAVFLLNLPTLTLAEALEASDLPADYAIDATAVVEAGDVSVAEAQAAFAAVTAILAGAFNSEELNAGDLFNWNVVDSAAAILAAAEEGAVAGADAVSITDELITLAQAEALAELGNFDGALPTVEYTLQEALDADSLADSYIVDPAAVVDAGTVTVEQAQEAFAAVTAIIAGADNAADLDAADLFLWNIADSAEAILDAQNDPAVTGAGDISVTDNRITESQAEALPQLPNFDGNLPGLEGDTFILTPGQDIRTGTEFNDLFVATQDTLQSGDDLDGGVEGTDRLELSIAPNSGNFFAAPTLDNIEVIQVNGPNLASGDSITLDLSNADGYNTLESFQTTQNTNGVSNGPIQSASQVGSTVTFRDIQDVNNTDIRVIDTNLDHTFTFDTNAYKPEDGNDELDLYLSEVDGSSLTFGDELPFGAGSGESQVDQVNLTSEQRVQVNTTTSNFVQNLTVGEFFNTLLVDGNADLEIEEFLDDNVNLVDASDLDADLALDLQGQGIGFTSSSPFAGRSDLLTVVGAQGDNRIDVSGDTHGDFTFFGGNDQLTVGNTSEFVSAREGLEGEDPLVVDTRDDVEGHLTVEMGGGNDKVLLNVTGLQDVQLEDGNDILVINGNVDDLRTPAFNDGRSVINAGAGNDIITLNDLPIDGVASNDYRVELESGNNTLTVNTSGNQIVTGKDGNNDVEINGNGDQRITLGDGVNDITINGDARLGRDSGHTIIVGDSPNDAFGVGNEITINGVASSTIEAGTGNDVVEVNGDGNQTVTSTGGDNTVTIEGVGVHDITLADGEDYVLIDGARLDAGNIDNTVVDTYTEIKTGAGDDIVDVRFDHLLNVELGEGDDQIILRAQDLTADDMIDGGDDRDTMTLTNAAGRAVDGNVNTSETSSTQSIEVFDLRDTNIRLALTSDNFDTAGEEGTEGHRNITVTTVNAASLALPTLTVDETGEIVEFTQGMGRDAYDTIRENWDDGVYTENLPVSGLSLEDWLLSQFGEEVDFAIDFVDGDASDDSLVYDDSDVVYEESDNAANDFVHFRTEPGTQTVDISGVPLSVLSGRSFNLEGGNVQDIVIADDRSINGRLTLDFDFDDRTNDSTKDTLVVMGSANITAADLRNVDGMEVLELKSNDTNPSTWDIQLNDRIINQTTGSSDLVIRVDPNVPAGSRVNITLDPTVVSANNNVRVETVGTAEIYIDKGDGAGLQLVDQPDFNSTDYNDGTYSLTVEPRLLFTTNTDSLVGTTDLIGDPVDDTFLATSVNQLQSVDTADGMGGDDTVQLDFAVNNPALSLFDQLDNIGLTSIEHIEFNTGNNVRMDTLGGIGDVDFVKLTTGSGNDTLTNMEALGTDTDEGYFLRGGDDFISLAGEDDTFYVDGGAGSDEIDGDDYGQNIYATDVEIVNLNNTQQTAFLYQNNVSVDGNVTVNGSSGRQDVEIEDQFLGTVTTNDVEFINDDSGASNTIVANNPSNDVTVDATDGGAGDTITVTDTNLATVSSGLGSDNIRIGSVTNRTAANYDVTNAVVFAGGGNDVIDVFVSNNAGGVSVSNSDVNNGSASGLFIASSDGINGGAGDDTITVVSGDDALVRGDAGDDRIDIEADDDVYVVGGTGNGDRYYSAIDATFGNYITVNADDNVFVAAGNAGDYIDIDSGDNVNVEGGNGDDTIIIDAAENVDVEGGAGDDTITVNFGDGVGGSVNTAVIDSGDGNDTITVNTYGDDTARITTGLGDRKTFERDDEGNLVPDGEGEPILIPTVSLAVDANGGEDTIVFGNIEYTATQQVDTVDTTQNYAPQAIPGQAEVTGYNDGFDTINGFNFEFGGAGEEDVLDFDAFLGSFDGNISYGDWTGGVNNVNSASGGGSGTPVTSQFSSVNVVAANENFVLDASHITNEDTAAGIEVVDNGRSVVIVGKDTNGDNNFDFADVYFVQDVDSDSGQAWAVDKVAEIDFATEIGTITSIDAANIA